MRSYLTRVYAVMTILVVLFMIGPVVVLMGVSFTRTNYVSFPPRGLTLDWYIRLLSDTELMRGLWLSIVLALVATVISIVLALGIVIYYRDRSGRMANLVNTYLLGPSFVPSLVIGIALLFLLSKVGMVGSLWGLICGHTVIALPFAIRSLASASASLDVSLERAAAIYGAKPRVVLTKVIIPLLRPGMLAGSLFAFLTSFNNITITLFIGGPRTRTLPVVLFQRTDEVVAPDIAAISTVVFILTVGVLILLQKKFQIFENVREVQSV